MLVRDRSTEGVDGQLMHCSRRLPSSVRALHLFGVASVNQGEGVLHAGALVMPRVIQGMLCLMIQKQCLRCNLNRLRLMGALLETDTG